MAHSRKIFWKEFGGLLEFWRRTPALTIGLIGSVASACMTPQAIEAPFVSCETTDAGAGCVESPLLRVEQKCQGTGNQTYTCAAQPVVVSRSVVLPGNPDVQHRVTLRIRGVVEQRSYAGGSDNHDWSIGGTYDTHNGYNVYRLEISGDSTPYYLNAGAFSQSAQNGKAFCVAVDYQKELEVAGGTTLTLTMDSVDDYILRNQRDNGQNTGAPLVVADVSPAPESFDGQFLQIDLVSDEVIDL